MLPQEVDELVHLKDMTHNSSSISHLEKDLEMVHNPPRFRVKFLQKYQDGGPSKWNKEIKVEHLHTWICSEAKDEENKMLVVCGPKRKDRDWYLMEFKDELEREKFIILLTTNGDGHCYKCIAPRLPTTEGELRNVTIDASWRPRGRKPEAIDPLGSINGLNPARVDNDVKEALTPENGAQLL